jgi:hypothetical protein
MLFRHLSVALFLSNEAPLFDGMHDIGVGYGFLVMNNGILDSILTGTVNVTIVW